MSQKMKTHTKFCWFIRFLVPTLILSLILICQIPDPFPIPLLIKITFTLIWFWFFLALGTHRKKRCFTF